MATNLGPFQDERGRTYYVVPGTTRRTYVSPVALGTGTRPADTTGLFRSAPQWNARTGDWETPLDWGNILNVAAASGLGAGAIHAAATAGAGAGAGGGAGAAAGGAAGGVAKEVVGIDERLGKRGGVKGAAKTGLNLGSLTDPQSLVALAGLLPSLIGAFRAGGGGGSPSLGDNLASVPGLNELLRMSVDRASRTDPLHAAVTQLAMARLPMSVQR